MNQAALPEPFAELAVFVDAWALPTEAERKEKRASSSLPELEAYKAAVGPRMMEIAGYLDQFPMGELPTPQRNLLFLALIYTEVAIALEFYHAPEIPNAFPRQRFTIRDIAQLETGKSPALGANP